MFVCYLCIYEWWTAPPEAWTPCGLVSQQRCQLKRQQGVKRNGKWGWLCPKPHCSAKTMKIDETREETEVTMVTQGCVPNRTRLATQCLQANTRKQANKQTCL